MTQLLLSNVPWNCEEAELRQWIEPRGFPVSSIRVIRDLVANGSPAFAYVTLHDSSQIGEAIEVLHGQKLKGHIVQVQVGSRRR